jgi:tripeptidyl-peptidase-1
MTILKRLLIIPLEVNATVEEAERLLKSEYHVYEHESGKEHVCE